MSESSPPSRPLRITLIEPTRCNMDGKPRRSRHTLLPTMTLPYLAALTPPRFQVRIIQERQEEIDFDSPVDLVGITAITLHIRRAYAIADQFRKRGVHVVMGGIHVTLNPDEARLHADTLVLGEAEKTWPRFLQDFSAGRPQPLYGPEPCPDLSGLPPPRWDLLPGFRWSQFRGPWKLLAYLSALRKTLFRPIVMAQTSRGCPVNCDYCTVTKFFGTQTRYRPVEDIVHEIRSLKARVVFFTDDNLFANPARAEELFAALRSLKIIWAGFAPISVGENPRMVKLARQSGCVAMFLGIESLSGASLAAVHKTVNRPEMYSRSLKVIRAAGIAPVALFMLGLDHEGQDILSRTYDFILGNRIPFAMLSILVPYPGTRVFERLKNEKRLREEAWWLKEGRPYYNLDFSLPGTTPEAFHENFMRHYRRIYTIKNSFLRAFAPPFKYALPIFFLNVYFGRNLRQPNTSILE